MLKLLFVEDATIEGSPGRVVIRGASKGI